MGRVTRARLESLVAADHTLANQATSIKEASTPTTRNRASRRRRATGTGRRRRRAPIPAYAFACSYFQGEVVSVEPDFGDGGGVRLAVTIAPWPEWRRTHPLVCAALRGGGGASSDVDPRATAPFRRGFGRTLRRDVRGEVGTRDVLEAVLVSGCCARRRGWRAETNVGVFSNVSRGVGGALAALTVGSFE